MIQLFLLDKLFCASYTAIMMIEAQTTIMKGVEIMAYMKPVKYTDKQLVYASLRDLVVDIRCARRDHCEANPLLAYAEKCIAEFRVLWATRHKH